MPITVSWDTEEQKAIRYDFMGDWTWPEFREAVAQTYALMETVPYTVHSIANFAESSALPAGAIQEVRQVMPEMPANGGLVIITEAGLFVNTLVQVFSRTYKKLGKKLAVTKTLDEARRLVDQNS